MTTRLLVSAVLFAVTIPAQQPPRAALPDAAPPAAPTREGTLPPARAVAERESSDPLDDRPDFAPLEDFESADGRHKLTRPKGNPYVLSFAGGDYTPAPGIDPELIELQRAEPGGAAFGYVMLRGRMADEKIATLRRVGVEVLDFHTWQSVVARIPLTRLQHVARLPFVHWIGRPRPQQLLGVRLARAMRVNDSDAPLEVYVTVFESDMTAGATRVQVGERRAVDRIGATLPLFEVMPNGSAQKALESAGLEPTFYDVDTFTFAGTATRAAVRRMQKLGFVRFLELRVPHRAHHDQTMAMIGQDRIRGTWPGTNVPVGVIDTGIDSSPWHKDFTGKRFLGWRSHNKLPSSYEDANGHGTHVAGTVFGRGWADKRYVGAAPSVGNGGEGDRIFIGRYLDNTGKSMGSVKSLYDVFKTSQSYNGKSNPKRALVNNSWGGRDKDGFKGTEYHSRTIDKIVFDANQSYVFSAGNKDDTPNWWAEEPACAKNVIAVGNVNDHWSSSTKPGQKNSTSRWGTADGRLKPEVSAPGGLVTSAKKNTSTGYTTMGGTSMAAPTVTGALASLIDRDAWFRYFPAGVKAAAIASASLDGTLYAESQRGYGQINSYRMNKAGKTTYHVLGGTLTKSGNYASADIQMSANLAAIRATLVMIEPAASAGASQARRNNVKLFIDIPPYSSGGNTGNFSVSSGHQTVLSYWSHGGALTQQARGKRVRFKVYADSIKSVDDVKFAVAVVQYFRAPSTSKKPTLQVTPSTFYIRPWNDLTLDTKLITHATADDFLNGRVWVEKASGWPMRSIRRTTADGIVQQYDDANTHPSANFPRVRTGSSGGMTVGTGDTRAIRFVLRSPSTEGKHDIQVNGSFHSGGLAQTVSKTVQICVDDTPPGKASNLKSTTHSVGAWSNKPKMTFTWSQITDNCAVDRQHYELSNGGKKGVNAGSPSVASAQGWATVNASSSKTGYYFNLGGVDRVGLWGPTVSAGPYRIDTVHPSISSLTLNGGSTHTSTLTVKAKLGVYDAHSGVADMQFSLNGYTWSPWYAYNSKGMYFSLASAVWGGSANQGVKKVWARVRDRAGNWSFVRTSIITYLKGPVLSKATVASVPSVSAKFFRFEGTDLMGVKSVEFAGKSITTKQPATHNSSWVNGYFKIYGSTVIRFFPPQGLPPGDYEVKVKGLSTTSNVLDVKITKNPTRIVRSAAAMLVNGLQTLIVTRGDQPSGSSAVIMASPSNQPSVVPGQFQFAIGNDFTSYVLLPEMQFDALGNARLAFPVIQAMVGLRAYFQAGYLNKRGPQAWPIPVSDVWSTTYTK